MKASNSPSTNTHTTSESWLRAGTDELRPYFAKLGYSIPENIRYSIAFTSAGKRGNIPGECWHPEASEDGYFKIILRPDTSDPVEILGILVHELVHALLPLTVKHGKEYRKIANRVGLEGEMRHARPDPILRERLQAIANNLGALPNAKLNYAAVSDLPKKQKSRHRKAECSACGYSVQITAKWAKVGLPVCPANAEHGLLQYDFTDDDGDESEPAPTATTNAIAVESIATGTITHHGKRKSKSVPDVSTTISDPSPELSNSPA